MPARMLARTQIEEEELARARVYLLLARLLANPPDDVFLQSLTDLSGGATPIGSALADLAGAASGSAPAAWREEFEALFVGIGRGELVPFASYYLTGFLHEKPLAALRADMARLGIAAADDVAEPEDHVAALTEMMAGLITGAFGAPADLASQERFFATHLAPWAGRFFADLEAAENARLYRTVGALGRALIDIETEAFALAA